MKEAFRRTVVMLALIVAVEASAAESLDASGEPSAAMELTLEEVLRSTLADKTKGKAKKAEDQEVLELPS